jgi:hypothetical protein
MSNYQSAQRFDCEAFLGVKILIELGSFINIDIHQKGSYSIVCRVYKKQRQSPGLRSNKRIDAYVLDPYEIKIDKQITGPEVETHKKPILLKRTTCSIKHPKCGWRCQSVGYSYKIGSKNTRFATDFFYLQYQDQVINLSTGALFHLDVPIELKSIDSRPNQECFIYIEFQLFFKDTTNPNNSIFKQVSSQMRTIRLSFTNTDPPFRKSIYHQVEFSGMYYATLDVLVSVIQSHVAFNENKVSKNVLIQTTLNLSFMKNSGSPSSILSANEASLKGITAVDCFKFHLKSLLMVHFDIITISKKDSNKALAIWEQLAGCIGEDLLIRLHLRNFEKVNEQDIINAINLIDGCNSFTFPVNIEMLFQTMNNFLEELINVWIKLYFLDSIDKMDKFRCLFRQSKNEEHNKSLIISNFKSLEDSVYNTTDNAINFANGAYRLVNWPIETPKFNVNLILPNEQKVPADSANSFVNKNFINGAHLFIFVHGLLGNYNDLCAYKNKISHYLKDLGLDNQHNSYFVSKCNLNNTFKHIAALGSALANEICDHIESEKLKVGRISFVCHSLGGIIARIAIRHKKFVALKELLYSFTSFATPHLSLILDSCTLFGSSNFILDEVLKVVKMISNSECIAQLKLQDHTNERECLLYRLAEDRTFGYFKFINFYGSRQDHVKLP